MSIVLPCDIFIRFVLEESAHYSAPGRCSADFQHNHFAVLKRASFSQDKTEWPWRGGANGSVRFYPEIDHAANAGMYLHQAPLFGYLDKSQTDMCL